MTRINVVDPARLSDKHLIAEYRELPRIFGCVRKAIARGEVPTDKRNPSQYVLGKGHMRFFYNKLGWLRNRQESLIEECLNRNFRIKYVSTKELAKGIPTCWMSDWLPTQEDVDLNVSRINERGGLRKEVDGRRKDSSVLPGL